MTIKLLLVVMPAISLWPFLVLLSFCHLRRVVIEENISLGFRIEEGFCLLRPSSLSMLLKTFMIMLLLKPMSYSSDLEISFRDSITFELNFIFTVFSLSSRNLRVRP